jgi:hypothetical protein
METLATKIFRHSAANDTEANDSNIPLGAAGHIKLIPSFSDE